MPIYGFGVFGPPGSGKSSFCKEVVELMRSHGRKVKLIDFDPANERPCYEADIKIQDLIDVETVMETEKLGFNAAIIYSMDFIAANLEWLMSKIKDCESGTVLVLDCPGQVELFIHHEALRKIFQEFDREGLRMASVYLMDSHCCTDPGKFISFLTTTLMSMTHIELPRINVLSKIDLIRHHDKRLTYDLNFYTQVLDLDRLVGLLDDDPITGRYKKLTAKLAEIIENYGLVQYTPLSLKEKKTVAMVLKLVDNAMGFPVSGAEVDLLASSAYCQEIDGELIQLVSEMNEKYVREKRKPVPSRLLGRIVERDPNGLFLVEDPRSQTVPGPSSSNVENLSQDKKQVEDQTSKEAELDVSDIESLSLLV